MSYDIIFQLFKILHNVYKIMFQNKFYIAIVILYN
jgi:hypothetical protein